MYFCRTVKVALLAEGVDRNQMALAMAKGSVESPSSRRAWIEMGRCIALGCTVPVALLAEGVDRNRKVKDIGMMLNVALLAEGVDRNSFQPVVERSHTRSPSSRRAWIEILEA